MKKIITFIIVFIGITTVSNASEKENTNNYIKLINENIVYINMQHEEKATIGSMLFNGINEGYILPSMNNENKLKNSLVKLIKNIEGYDIENPDLIVLNNLFINDINDLITLLDERVDYKLYTLNSDNRLMKYKYILINDSDNIDIINNKIELINKTYKEIKGYNKKFNSKKYA